MSLEHPIEGIVLTATSGEVCRKSWWELELQSPAGKMPDNCQYRIRQVPSPTDEISALSYSPVNSEYLYPGLKKAAGNVCMNLHLYEKDQLYDFFRSWRKKIYDPEMDAVALYSDVVGSGKLKLYVPGEGGNAQMTRQMQLIDVWPSNMSVETVDRDSDGEPLGYTVTLQIMEVKDD